MFSVSVLDPETTVVTSVVSPGSKQDPIVPATVVPLNLKLPITYPSDPSILIELISYDLYINDELVVSVDHKVTVVLPDSTNSSFI